MELIPRLFKDSLQSYFLFGPRGTGKSQWVSQAYDNPLTINLLEPETHRSLHAHPERLRELIKAHPESKTVVIDEVQKVPEVLSVVHDLIEKKKGVRFVLTGSSARKLKRSGVDLMAGRAIVLHMHPFMASELGNLFCLEDSLHYGLLPLVLGAKDREMTLKSYIGVYLREEVQMEALVRNVGQFSRFLEAATFSQGSVLNLSNISSDCGVERKTVEGYVKILEDLLLSYRLPVFTKRAKRETIVHPKFYYFDAGVYRSLRPSGPLDTPEEINGSALETLVFQNLKAWNSYRRSPNEIYYWRTKSGSEVDFIVYGKDGLFAIEVKNSNRIREEDLRSLNTFLEDYPQAQGYFLYRGKDALKKGKILCLPCEDFLKKLHPKNSKLWTA